MSDVASLELSKELYELSGWGAELNDWRSNSGTGVDGAYPAYDAGYLLRKLPIYCNVEHDKVWSSTFDNVIDNFTTIAAIPENALCQLAIELFKQGILKREE